MVREAAGARDGEGGEGEGEYVVSGRRVTRGGGEAVLESSHVKSSQAQSKAYVSREAGRSGPRVKSRQVKSRSVKGVRVTRGGGEEVLDFARGPTSRVKKEEGVAEAVSGCDIT
jgi:hypothetical protein